MSTPAHEASHPEERPADLAERFVTIRADRILAAASRARAEARFGGLPGLVDPDRHGNESIAGALADGRKMRYCAAPQERLALALRRLLAVRGLSQIARRMGGDQPRLSRAAR